MKPTYVETIPESVSAASTLENSRKYCPTSRDTPSSGAPAPRPGPLPMIDAEKWAGPESQSVAQLAERSSSTTPFSGFEKTTPRFKTNPANLEGTEGIGLNAGVKGQK
jgi:hypothetical protein